MPGTLVTSCPSWCPDRGLHDLEDLVHDARTGDLVCSHSGPGFGPVTTGGDTTLDGAIVGLSVDLDDVLVDRLRGSGWTPVTLRQFAAAVIDAADWLEEQA